MDKIPTAGLVGIGLGVAALLGVVTAYGFGAFSASGAEVQQLRAEEDLMLNYPPEYREGGTRRRRKSGGRGKSGGKSRGKRSANRRAGP
jgi:hypothetical protein